MFGKAIDCSKQSVGKEISEVSLVLCTTSHVGLCSFWVIVFQMWRCCKIFKERFDNFTDQVGSAEEGNVFTCVCDSFWGSVHLGQWTIDLHPWTVHSPLRPTVNSAPRPKTVNQLHPMDKNFWPISPLYKMKDRVTPTRVEGRNDSALPLARSGVAWSRNLEEDGCNIVYPF